MLLNTPLNIALSVWQWLEIRGLMYTKQIIKPVVEFFCDGLSTTYMYINPNILDTLYERYKHLIYWWIKITELAVICTPAECATKHPMLHKVKRVIDYNWHLFKNCHIFNIQTWKNAKYCESIDLLNSQLTAHQNWHAIFFLTIHDNMLSFCQTRGPLAKLDFVLEVE